MDGQGDPPTSCCDSLVVVWAGDEQGSGEKPPNELQWLVGGCMGRDERGRGGETHQRGNSFTFPWAELAPPSGLMGANYSR